MSEPFRLPFELGDHAEFSKTVTETDIVLFAGITGDMNQVHLDEAYCAGTPLKHRIAHGALTFSIGSAPETTLLNLKQPDFDRLGLTYVSAGADHVRFVKPVFIGDTLHATYTIVNIDHEKMRTVGHGEVTNQHGEVVCVFEHMWRFFRSQE